MKKGNNKTLVMGASLKPERYSNIAIRMLKEHNIETVAIGLREGEVDGVIIQQGEVEIKEVDTITIYVGQDRLTNSEDYILSLKPKRVIFNPGAENPLFAERLKKEGVEIVNACTLVMLRTDQY